MSSDAEEQEAAMMQQDEEEAGLNISRILMPTKEGNPFLNPKVSVDDEGYSSHYWYRPSHENTTFGPTLDSRYEDRHAQTDSQNGMIFLTQGKVYRFVERPIKVNTKGFSLPGIGLRRGKPKRKKSGEPLLETEGFQQATVVPKVWIRERNQVQKELGWKEEQYDDLTDEQKAKVLERATPRFLEKYREYIVEERRWFPTTMNVDALKQSPKRPFFFVPDWLLELMYKDERELKRLSHQDNPDWTPYLYGGCPDDEALVSFIRDDADPGNEDHKPPQDYFKKEVDQFGNPTYKVARYSEDERALTIRAHNRAVEYVQDAEGVYKFEEITKRVTGFYENDKFFGDIQESDGDRARFQEWLEDHEPGEAPKGLPPSMPRSEEAFYAKLSEKVKGGFPKHSAQALARQFRRYYEDWMEANYDRWLPSECYAYREQFFDRVSMHGSDWESRADAIWDVMSLQIFVITPPKIVGIFPNLIVDWTDFRAYVAPIENRRDIVRLYNHWKMAKSLNNTRASYDIDTSDIKTARRQDAGGPHTGLKRSIREWRYRKLREAANGDPVRQLDLLGPIWSKKQPHEPMDHDGALFSRYAQKPQSVDDGIKKVRELSSRSGKADFPKADKLRSDYLVKVRSYRSEWWQLQNDEYTARDQVDVFKNQNGCVTRSLLHENNNRLEGPFAHAPHVRMNYKNCTDFAAFIVMMSHNLPPEPIVQVVEEKIAAWEHENIEHWRKELNEELEGVFRSKGRHGLDKYFTGFYQKKGQEDRVLDGSLRPGQEYRELLFNEDGSVVVRKPRKNAAGVYERKAFEREYQWVKGWYERSDNRLDDFLYRRIAQSSHKGKGGASGAYNFDATQAGKDNTAGYGIGYGTLVEQDNRQNRRVEIGLKCTYYQTMKSIIQWFNIALTMKIFIEIDEKSGGISLPRGRVTIDDVKSKISSAIEGSKLLWVYAEYLLWPRLKKMAPEIVTGHFPERSKFANVIDDEFIKDELNFLAGVDARPSRWTLLQGKADKEEFAEIIEENRERYKRIIEQRFFEINGHHAA